MKLQEIIVIATAGLSAADVIAYTKYGPMRGVQVHDAVNAFLGVRYAQPPLGDLRFQPPQPLQNYGKVGGYEASSPIKAMSLGPSCHQFMYNLPLGSAFKPSTEESEDCLTLNIYVPKGADLNKRMPVYVWSPGGAYGEGSSSVPVYNPTGFVAENKDIIVVTWNYRLNIFGFPNSPALEAQNLGLRDQRFALEWIRDNIRDFGGDPSRIVLGGQSAGAVSVDAMMYSHPRDPIVSGLILQSGTVQMAQQMLNQPLSDVDSEFIRVAKKVGCANADRKAELECMRKVDAQKLKNAVSSSRLNKIGSPYGGMPMVDNKTLFTREEYERRGDAGEFALVPTLLGTTNNEGDSVVNWNANGINKTLSDIITENFFDCNIALESRFRALNKVPVWRYLYKGVFPEVTLHPWMRAYHAADVPLLMGTYNLLATNRTIASDTTTKEASRFLQDFFAAFIRSPACGLWDKFRLSDFRPNTATLIELFPENKPTLDQVMDKENSACLQPASIMWDQM